MHLKQIMHILLSYICCFREPKDLTRTSAVHPTENEIVDFSHRGKIQDQQFSEIYHERSISPKSVHIQFKNSSQKLLPCRRIHTDQKNDIYIVYPVSNYLKS